MRLIIASIFAAFGLAVLPLSYAQVQAAPVDPFKQACESAPKGAKAPAACKEKEIGKSNPLFGPEGILTKVINILSIVVGISAVIGIMAAGLKYIISGDNPQEVSSARGRVIYAMIALIVAASAQLMVRFILYKIE